MARGERERRRNGEADGVVPFTVHERHGERREERHREQPDELSDEVEDDGQAHGR